MHLSQYLKKYIFSSESYDIAQEHCRRGEFTSNIDSGPENQLETQFRRTNKRTRLGIAPKKRKYSKFLPGDSKQSIQKSSETSESDERQSDSDEHRSVVTPFLGLVGGINGNYNIRYSLFYSIFIFLIFINLFSNTFD